MARWSLIPLNRRATATLRGLRVDAPGQSLDGSVFGWGNISAMHTQYGIVGWQVFTDAGESYREDGRLLILRLKKTREHRLAERAQRRFFSLMRRADEFQLTEQFSHRRVDLWRALAMVTVLCMVLGGTGLGLLRAWNAAAESNGWYVLQLRSAVFLFLLLFGIPLAMALTELFYSLRVRPPVLVQADAQTIRAFDRDGGEVTAAWSHLREVRASLFRLELRFAGGAQIALAQPSSRVRALLRVMEERFCPEEVARHTRGTRRMYVRAGTLWVIGAVLIGVMMELVETDSPVSHPGLWAAAMMIVAPSILIAGSLGLERARRHRRRASTRQIQPLSRA